MEQTTAGKHARIRGRCGSPRRLLAAMLMAAIGLSAASAAADTSSCKRVILTGDPDYPPFSWYEDKVFQGSAIEIVGLALKRIQLPYEIRYVGPFPKVLAAAREGQVDLIAELKSTPERKEYLAFSDVPIFPNPVAVFTRVDQELAFRNWEDLIGLRGGITVGNKFGGGLDEFLENRLAVESASRIDDNFTKLAKGRIDYFVNSYYPALAYLNRARRKAAFKVLQPFAAISDNFVGWSRASLCLDKLRELDAALAAMVRSGEARRIGDTHLDRLRQNPSRDRDR
jgi:polar amino acid transport system substrate-binding protein